MVELKLDPQKHTKYEKARIIGARSMQISMGAPLLLKLTPKRLEELKYDPLEIAKLEYEEGVIPLAVIRDVIKKEDKEKDSKSKKDKE
ncbi:MAG TPA: DNA-directed RNA polymerase subunit K [Allocoleopsis sp.]